MHLCDSPEQVGDYKSLPVPIILTGNNLLTLYGPLKRHGRMRFFEWIPNTQEKHEIVSRILKELSPQPSTVNRLLNKYPHKSIAFFHQIKIELLNILTPSLIDTLRVEKSREGFNKAGARLIQDFFKDVDEVILFDTAKQIDVSVKDYLTDGYQK